LRNYTQASNISGNLLLAENQNQEIKGIVEPLNGSLDMNQLPLLAIDQTKVAVPTAYSYNQTTGMRGPLKAYYKIAPRTSTLTFAQASGNIFQGWNIIESDWLLEFQAKEGMIKGSAIVCGSKLATISGGAEVGTESAWEIAVFANDVMIAQSGYVPVGLYTLDLPYAFPVGNEFITIDVRWRQYNTAMNSTWTYPDMQIRHRHQWCVNIYR
tara:strand:+ start:2670 stop:3305 length:636 start_codon:yes stop_codon:yes gene_type:complete